MVSLRTIINNKRVLEGWSGCKTRTYRKRTLWACGPELRLRVNMGQNTPKPLYNVLWQTSTWIVVITRSLQTLITEFVHKEPRVTLPVCGFLANSFLGKEGSWALHNHSTNSSLLPGWTRGWPECEDKEKAAWGDHRAVWVALPCPSEVEVFVCSILKQGTWWIVFWWPCLASFLERQFIWFSLSQRNPGNIYGPNLSVEEMAVAMSLPPFQFSDQESVHLYMSSEEQGIWGLRQWSSIRKSVPILPQLLFLVRSNKRLSSIVLQSSALLYWV